VVYGPKGLGQPILDNYTSAIKNEVTAFQPRLGVAWNLRKNTVVRFGGGIFYGKTVGSAIKTVVSGAGESNINCTPGQTGLCAGLVFPDTLVDQQDIPVQPGPL
jgi:hypothetical protein